MRRRSLILMDLGLLAIALLSALYAFRGEARISSTDYWYHNLDMDMTNTADALLINSDCADVIADQPGLPMKYLLALAFRVEHYERHFRPWNLKKFGESSDPIAVLPALIAIGREQSRWLTLAVMVTAGVAAGLILRSFYSACLAVILVAGCPGLLFQGLMVRPELLCTGFGVIAIASIARSSPAKARPTTFLTAGLAAGFSILTKLPGFLYLVIIIAAAWCASNQEFDKPVNRRFLARYLRPMELATPAIAFVAGWLAIGLTRHLRSRPIDFSVTDAGRLRDISVMIVAAGVGAWLLAGLGPPRLRQAVRGGVLAASGALLTLPLSYGLLRLILSDDSASWCTAKVIRTLVNPGNSLRAYASNPDWSAEFIRFLAHDRWRFALASLGLISVFTSRQSSPAERRAVASFFVCALGMAALLAKRYFIATYPIFTEVPLALSLAVSVPTLLRFATSERAALMGRLGTVMLAAVFIPGAMRRATLEYSAYQADSDLRSRVEWLYESPLLANEYRFTMQRHYGTEADFRTQLQAHLASGLKP